MMTSLRFKNGMKQVKISTHIFKLFLLISYFWNNFEPIDTILKKKKTFWTLKEKTHSYYWFIGCWCTQRLKYVPFSMLSSLLIWIYFYQQKITTSTTNFKITVHRDRVKVRSMSNLYSQLPLKGCSLLFPSVAFVWCVAEIYWAPGDTKTELTASILGVARRCCRRRRVRCRDCRDWYVVAEVPRSGWDCFDFRERNVEQGYGCVIVIVVVVVVVLVVVVVVVVFSCSNHKFVVCSPVLCEYYYYHYYYYYSYYTIR